jgi:hypothetical protein
MENRRRIVKQVLKKLKKESIVEALLIEETIALLEARHWETPEQYKKRTGESWPDDWAVYALYETNDGERQWFCESCGYAQHKGKRKSNNPKIIICAGYAGPPPDDWRPEETECVP